MNNEDTKYTRRMEVMGYVRRHILTRCNMPTLREIIANTESVTSLCTARNDVLWLIERGMLVQTRKYPLEFTLPELRHAALELAAGMAQDSMKEATK